MQYTNDRTNAQPGTVYLVGAGPGAPDLITVRGWHALAAADVVLYDRLVHPALLAECRAEADLVDVGKLPGCHKVPQSLIIELLIAAARRGQRVVRLKGGDPFVFGRGSEEAAALAGAGVPFEVVPGLSSAIAVPAHAGIPVTHRKVSSHFTVVTGHECVKVSPDFATMPRGGTLVILMGLRRLPQIAEKLMGAGWSAETPVAVIQNGSLRDQETVLGSLGAIAGRVTHMRSPATIIVGEVVRLAPDLTWFNRTSVPHGNFDTPLHALQESVGP